MAAPTASKNGSALDALDEAILGTDSTIVYNASKSPATARWQFAPWSAVLTYIQTALGLVFQPLATVLTNTTAAFTTAQETKLAVIEAAADVTDAGNVAAAGAVMTSGALGTPASGTLTNCTGLPIAGLVASTTQAVGVGSVELGHASDTTITRTGAGAIAVEGAAVLLSGGALGTPASGTLTNCTGLPVAGITASTTQAVGVGSVELGHASDTTISRVSAGLVSVEGVPVLTATAPNDQTGTTYTLVLADANRPLTLNNASAIALTIPANGTVAFPIGTFVPLMQLGAGQVTVGITSDTLNVNSTFQLKLAGQHSVAGIYKKAATTWVLFGDLALA